MKVLHLVKTSEGGTWAFRLMRDLVTFGIEVHVAIPLGGKLIKSYREAGIIIHPWMCSIKHAVKSCQDLKNIVNIVHPDIIHSHFVLTTIIMRLALRKIHVPRIFEVPGPLHLEHYIYRQADIRLAQKGVDYWIPTCSWSYNMYLICGISKDRLFLTYYGNDLLNKKYEKGKLRHELNLNDSDIVVGMVAYMYAPKRFLGEKRGLKGHEDLIDAVALLQNKYTNLHLVIVGGAWNGAVEYEKRVIAYGKQHCRNIHFLGTRNDVPELYQDFNMVVHPSHSENLGGAAESLSLGVPTITTNVGGFPDIVVPGKTGYLVPPYSPKEISEAIDDIITYPEKAKKMALNGQIYVHKLLDSKNTSRSVYSFYSRILNDNQQQ